MIYYGFDEVLYGWSRYFDLCNAFEMRHAHQGEDAPSLATLNKWRVDSPRGFAWVLHADPSFVEALVEAYERNEAAVTDAMREGWRKTQELAHALAAKAMRPDPSDPTCPAAAAVCVYPDMVAVAKEMRDGCYALEAPDALTVFDNVYTTPNSWLERQKSQYAAYLRSFDRQASQGGAQ